MKKVLCFAAAAMALFASCQKTEVVYDNDDPQEIALFAVNKVATKAPVTGAAFLDGDNMRVSAYLAYEDGNNNENVGYYFENILFSKPDAGDTWVGGQYWPLSTATMNFLAVTQKGGGVVDDKNIEFDDDNHKFTVVIDNNVATSPLTNDEDEVVNQTDLMYACARHTNNAGGAGTAGNVPMTFNHALAWVNFSFKSNTQEDVLVVKSVELNARYNGTVEIAATNFNASNVGNPVSAAANWTVKANAFSMLVPNASNNGVMRDVDLYNAVNVDANTLNDVYTAFGNGLLVVPTESGDDPYFVITYTIAQVINDNGDTVNKEYTYKHVLTDEVWEAGKKYTYNIKINLQEIEIEPEVEPWVEQTAEEVPLG